MHSVYYKIKFLIFRLFTKVTMVLIIDGNSEHVEQM